MNINGTVGDSRQCSEYGLPQGSVLSPVLFKIYVSDFLTELKSRKDIVLYKFADDGTVKVTAENSQTCLETVQYVLECLQNWTSKWRMKINCDKNKTELLCFNTAENNKDIIPLQFKLGDQSINRVSQTKVLGLVIDDDLTYIPHSQEVLKSLHLVWQTLCKYSSRHWGLNQNVMLHLIKALFISKLSYASHIWMNKVNTQEINKLWYHVIKSIKGAVLIISQSIAEVILGVPPLLIQTTVNNIKHFLKININPIPQDSYAEFICSTYNDAEQSTLSIHNKLKVVFKFLQWKSNEYMTDFTKNDLEITSGNRYGRFFELTAKACSYSKKVMNQYIEDILWKSSLKTQFQLEGYHNHPIPSCSIIPVPSNSNRKSEVLLMSMMYKNNILRSSLYKLGKVSSPLCSLCTEEEETADHILFRCSAVDRDLRKNAFTAYKLANNLVDGESTEVDFIELVNTSRNRQFVLSCMIILNDIDLNVTVEL